MPDTLEIRQARLEHLFEIMQEDVKNLTEAVDKLTHAIQRVEFTNEKTIENDKRNVNNMDGLSRRVDVLETSANRAKGFMMAITAVGALFFMVLGGLMNEIVRNHDLTMTNQTNIGYIQQQLQNRGVR